MIIRAENSHDSLVDSRQEHAQWISYILMRPFLSPDLAKEQQLAMRDYIVSSPDIPVASLTLVTDPETPDVHLIMEVRTNEQSTSKGDTPENQALTTGLVAALGAFVSAGVEPRSVILLEAHISPSEQLSADERIFPAASIIDGRYRVPDLVAQDIYSDEQAGYAHLQNFGHSFI